jgi:uncharacterized transporter YbjL
MGNNIWFSISAIVFSGIFGVILTIVVQRKMRKTDLKHEVLTRFVENRYDLKGDDFTKALNTIYHLFSKDKKVIRELKTFHKVICERSTKGEETNNKLRNVYMAMCHSLKVIPMDEELFFKPFNIKY